MVPSTHGYRAIHRRMDELPVATSPNKTTPHFPSSHQQSTVPQLGPVLRGSYPVKPGTFSDSLTRLDYF